MNSLFRPNSVQNNTTILRGSRRSAMRSRRNNSHSMVMRTNLGPIIRQTSSRRQSNNNRRLRPRLPSNEFKTSATVTRTRKPRLVPRRRRRDRGNARLSSRTRRKRGLLTNIRLSRLLRRSRIANKQSKRPLNSTLRGTRRSNFRCFGGRKFSSLRDNANTLRAFELNSLSDVSCSGDLHAGGRGFCAKTLSTFSMFVYHKGCTVLSAALFPIFPSSTRYQTEWRRVLGGRIASVGVLIVNYSRINTTLIQSLRHVNRSVSLVRGSPRRLGQLSDFSSCSFNNATLINSPASPSVLGRNNIRGYSTITTIDRSSSIGLVTTRVTGGVFQHRGIVYHISSPRLRILCRGACRLSAVYPAVLARRTIFHTLTG